MSCRISYRWNHDYPRLAKELGFKFVTDKPNVLIDWNSIGLVDIDKVVTNNDVRAIERHFNDVINYNLQSEETKILDSKFLKIFYLAQLAIEYLLFCLHYVDQGFCHLQKNNSDTAEEIEELHRKLSKKEKSLNKYKKQVSELQNLFSEPYSNKNVVFKCIKCNKQFINKEYLESHEKRRHSNINFEQNESPKHEIYKSETERLHLEIKQLKERLNNTERILKTNSLQKNETDVKKDTYNSIWDRDFPDSHLSEQKQINDNLSKDNKNEAKDISIQCNLINDVGNQLESIKEELRKWKEGEQKEFTAKLDQIKDNVNSDIQQLKSKLLQNDTKEVGKLSEPGENKLDEKLKQITDKIEQQLKNQEQIWRERLLEIEEKNTHIIPKPAVRRSLTTQHSFYFDSELEKSESLVQTIKTINNDVFEMNENRLTVENNTENNENIIVEKQANVNKTDIKNNSDTSEITLSEKNQKHADLETVKSKIESIPVVPNNSRVKNRVSHRKSANENKMNMNDSSDESIITEVKQNKIKTRSKVTFKSNIKPIKESTKNDSTDESIQTEISEEEVKTKNKVNVKDSYKNVVEELKNKTSSNDMVIYRNKNMMKSSERFFGQEISTSESEVVENKIVKQKSHKFRHENILNLRNDPKVLLEFKKTVEKLLYQNLSKIGVNPEWKTLPFDTFRQQNSYLKHLQKLQAKTHPEYFEIRKQLISQIDKKLTPHSEIKKQETSKPKPMTSTPVRKIEGSPKLAKFNDSIEKMKSKVLSVLKSDRSIPETVNRYYKLTVQTNEKQLEQKNAHSEVTVNKIYNDVFKIKSSEDIDKNIADNRDTADVKKKSMYSNDSLTDSEDFVEKRQDYEETSSESVKNDFFKRPVSKSTDVQKKTVESNEVKVLQKIPQGLLKPADSLKSLSKKKVLFDLDSKKSDSNSDWETESENQAAAKEVQKLDNKQNKIIELDKVAVQKVQELSKVVKTNDIYTDGDSTSISSSVFDGYKSNLNESKIPETSDKLNKQKETSVSYPNDLDLIISDFEFSSDK